MIKLPEICDRQMADILLPDLLNAEGNEPVLFDASAVRQIGQPVLQLLLCAAKYGAGVRILNASEAVCKMARLAGVEEELLQEAAS